MRREVWRGEDGDSWIPLALRAGAFGLGGCARRRQIVDEASRWGFGGSVQKGTLGMGLMVRVARQPTKMLSMAASRPTEGARR
jgi:hypothetical protein